MATVLLAHPHEQLRSQFAAVLEEADHELVVATSGKEAVQRGVDVEAAIAFVSSHFSDKEGEEVCKLLRKGPGGHRLATVLMGPQFWEPGAGAKATQRSSADAFLALPCRRSRLLEVLETLLLDHRSAEPMAAIAAEVQTMYEVLDETDYYTLLGTSEDVDRSTLTAVFQRLSRQYHPDLHRAAMGTTDYERLIMVYKRMCEAYSVLSRPAQRQAYNVVLAQGQTVRLGLERKVITTNEMPAVKVAEVTSTSDRPRDLPESLPCHVAIIMDGNGRWAEQRGLSRLEGHRRGADAVRTITRACRRWGIEYLTLYAFSEQNWSRPDAEVSGLMELLAEFVMTERGEILDNDIRLDAVGDLGRLPEFARDGLKALMKASENNTSMTLCLALSYGGREEIVEAARSACEAAIKGELVPKDLDEEMFRRWLWRPEMPDPDLIVRTSGELRVSNFLLWQIAYSEFVLSDVFWPDFGEDELLSALKSFAKRERRYGKISSQIRVEED